MLVPLTQCAYEAQSIIASAQNCINLYLETNPKDSPVPATHYTTPGLTSTSFNAGLPARWEYTASNGNIYSVYGNLVTGSKLYVSTPASSTKGIGSTTLISTFNSYGTTPVSMADNGLVLIIVDGSANGWALDLTGSNSFAQIADVNFLGASKVDYLDTFFTFNVPNTNQWYVSLSEATYAMFTGATGSILTGTITSGGTNSITNGVYNTTSLTGGTGTGAVANLTVATNNVTIVNMTSPGMGYIIGDELSANLPGTGIGTFTINAGSGYTNGMYSDVPLTGGSGSNGTANITVNSNVVTSVDIQDGGAGYVNGDVITAALPGGSGFNITLTSVVGTGFIYTIDTIGGTAFDPLDIATKNTSSDPIVALIVMHAEVWLLGSQTTEIWYNAGAADFTFQIFPGVFIEHGCVAQYSVAKQDLNIYWLSQDKQGQAIIVKGNGYAAHRISTFALENEFSKYSKISDAIGWTYQQLGHVFYVLTFPSADKTWVWDENTQLWHERLSLQYVKNGVFTLDGNLHKVIYNSSAICGGLVYVSDYLGNMWQLDPTNYTENGVEITRIRSFPHLLNSQKRVNYTQFIADMECGTDDASITGDGTSSSNPPVVNLRWSDDRGKTYGNYIQQSLGALGQYLTNMQWRRLGIARDRVFELSWSAPTKTALNAAWVEFTPSQT